MFPARAGMSPGRDSSNKYRAYVPRASGDEPAAAHAGAMSTGCSPRERG